MKKSFKKIVLMIICIITLNAVIGTTLFNIKVLADNKNKQYTETEIMEIAKGIINWKKIDNGSTPEGNLINNTFLELAGSTPGDWFPIGISRLGVADDYDGYLAVIKEIVQNRYKQPSKLSSAKATEWHRISLAILAMGGDPTKFGKDENGEPINLIADGSYNRGKKTSLGRQGINGWIWGLITVDSKRYDVPKDAFNTRDDIIIEILRQQLADGGFALSGKTADPDITAMALQSLSPYYNSEKVYSYKQRISGKEVKKTVRQIVDESLTCLSKLQLPTGDFRSWGTQNVESTDQVVVALCSLGVNPLQDERFIKKGKSLVDGILTYKMKDGGFVHSYTYDDENPTSLPDQSNTMASEQTLYTMASIVRQIKNQRKLYDFRPEQSNDLKDRIKGLEQKISKLGNGSDKATLEAILKEYYSIPEDERDYVCNYWTLSDMSKKIGINISDIAGKTDIVESAKDPEEIAAILYFSKSDKKQVDTLPSPLTTEEYVLVTKLLEKLKNSEEFDEKQVYLKKLEKASSEIAKIQKEIDSINGEVRRKLYPFESMSIKNKFIIDNLAKRYNNLSEYDKAKIYRWDDVIKTKTKVDNMLRGIIIAVILSIIVAILSVVVIKRIKKRKRKKQTEMDELAALYEDEEEEQ